MEWIKLVEFGQYQHSKGLQVVDRDSAENMVEYFHSLRGKFMRRFLGLPIYIGHPDDPEYTDRQDKTIYGRIENLKIEDDALWILSRWTSMGKKIFGNKFLKYLSPRWMMKKLSDKIFSPVRLLSVGLTNHPNVRCEHTVNVIEQNNDKQLSELVDNEGVTNISSDENLSDASTIIDDTNANQNSTEMDVSSPVVEDATADNSESFDSRWHTCSLSDNLVERRPEMNTKDKILRLVYDHMLHTGDDYQSAWMTVKRQNPGLFQ